jgi:uncharacterized lipoprotein
MTHSPSSRFSIALALVACLSLGACKHRVPSCAKPGGYEKAESIAPLRIPNGLQAPDTRGALKIPDLNEAAAAPLPAGQCLDTPPRYNPNARLVAPPTDKKSKRAQKKAPAPVAPAPAPPAPAAPATTP